MQLCRLGLKVTLKAIFPVQFIEAVPIGIENWAPVDLGVVCVHTVHNFVICSQNNRTSAYNNLISWPSVYCVYVDVLTYFTQYIMLEFSENFHTPSPQGLVFGGTIEFSRLPRFDLDLTSSDLQWRHNLHFDIFHLVYHVRILWKFPHTLPSRSSFWRYHRIFEATSIWPPVTSNDIIIDILTYFTQSIHQNFLKICTHSPLMV